MKWRELLTETKMAAWIDVPEFHLRAFLRATFRCAGEDIYPTAEIAAVEVREEWRGKGLFTQFLEEFEKEAEKQGRVVMIESIQERSLIPFLDKREYISFAYEPANLYLLFESVQSISHEEMMTRWTGAIKKP